jgi:hypothetical protein
MAITNQNLQDYIFLKGMYNLPNALIGKGRQIFIRLCEEIEHENPTSETNLYKLTHVATTEFNTLANELEKNGGEIETEARERIASDFDFIVKAYGFDLDIEQVISPRDW